MIRFFTTLFIPLLCLVMVGCIGGDGEIDIDTPPPISDAKRVAVVPFFADAGATEDVVKLGGRISVNLATRLELIFKDAEWEYDISNKVKPVDDKLTELGLTPEQVYADPALAAKLGQALEADMVIIGMVDKPKLTRQDYDQHLMKQGRQGGISGTSTYIRTRLTAIGRARVKVVDAGSGDMLFNNRIRSYLKYWYAYQTQQSEQIIFKSDTDRLADLGKYLSLRIAYSLYPTGLRLETEEQILLKPDIVLKGTGGVVEFN
ncbi:MAG: hypothetical protein OYL97_00480 [Candidatus Poribacteria bacterium]|nr:hypothetical protein [Candidatus Poribacteria bacterium]